MSTEAPSRPPVRAAEALAAGQRRVLGAAAFLVGVLGVGVVGYKLIGGARATWLDALYMAVVTLTTTGYREVIDIAGHPVGQLFTITLLLFGATGVLYFASTITAFVVEGDLSQLFRRRRMERSIAALRGHHVVCGGGRTGTAVVRELLATGRQVVVIERNAEAARALDALGLDCPVLTGDATDAETLQAAAIAEAQGLVLCTDDDKEALVVIVTARQLNPALRIVARGSDRRAVQRLRAAGADTAVSLAEFGGLRLVNELVRPGVTGFLDELLHDSALALRIEEVVVPAGARVAGAPVQSLDLHEYGADLLLLAMRGPDGASRFNPPGSAPIPAEGRLIVMGAPSAVARLRERVAG